MKYRCIIVDDEELARNLIQKHLAQLDDFELVANCASAIEANTVLKNEKVDLLFLDIEMPVLKGTDFLKNLLHQPKVIFTTAYRDFALEGFELNAVDYLLKPISFARFFKGIEKFLEQTPSPTAPVNAREERKIDSIFVRKDRKQVKLLFADILYIESVKDYVKIITEKETHLTKYSLSAFQDSLDDRFIRTHRSYLVNLTKITAYTNHDVEIGTFEVPIGDSYRAAVLDALRH